MQKIRDFGFPAALIVAWMVAAAYTLSLMIEAPGGVARPEAPAVVEADATSAS
jgi:hypothetical protein